MTGVVPDRIISNLLDLVGAVSEETESSDDDPRHHRNHSVRIKRRAAAMGHVRRARVAFLSHSENTTFLAEDPVAGERLVLRVQRIGYHSSAEIVSELAWIESADHG